VLGIAPSRYYEWERKQQSERAVKDDDLLASIHIFAKFRGRYGAPRLHDQLGRESMRVSRKRVARLMREAGLRAKGRRKYKATTDPNHALPVAPNRLERNFHAEHPDSVWVSDITYICTRQGWMYLAVILDLYSRKVVGWSLAERLTAALVCNALAAAVRLRRSKSELIFHRDRGSLRASDARMPLASPILSPRTGSIRGDYRGIQ
jgi:putative transposase